MTKLDLAMRLLHAARTVPGASTERTERSHISKLWGRVGDLAGVVGVGKGSVDDLRVLDPTIPPSEPSVPSGLPSFTERFGGHEPVDYDGCNTLRALVDEFSARHGRAARALDQVEEVVTRAVLDARAEHVQGRFTPTTPQPIKDEVLGTFERARRRELDAVESGESKFPLALDESALLGFNTQTMLVEELLRDCTYEVLADYVGYEAAARRLHTLAGIEADEAAVENVAEGLRSLVNPTEPGEFVSELAERSVLSPRLGTELSVLVGSDAGPAHARV